MAHADLGLVAAAILVLAACVEGCRRPGRLRRVMLGAFLLLPINLALAWRVEDAPGTTVEGMAAAFGILSSFGLCAAAAVASVSARLARSFIAE